MALENLMITHIHAMAKKNKEAFLIGEHTTISDKKRKRETDEERRERGRY